MTSSHCPVQTACARKHVAAHAKSCSIYKKIRRKATVKMRAAFRAFEIPAQFLAPQHIRKTLLVFVLKEAFSDFLCVLDNTTSLRTLLFSSFPFFFFQKRKKIFTSQILHTVCNADSFVFTYPEKHDPQYLFDAVSLLCLFPFLLLAITSTSPLG